MVASTHDGSRGWRSEHRIEPHHPGEFGSRPLVLQQFHNACLTLAEDQSLKPGEARIAEGLDWHGLGLVAADHDVDGGLQTGRDPRADVVRRSKQVEAGPAR